MPGSRERQIESGRSTSSKTKNNAPQKSKRKPRASSLSAEIQPSSESSAKIESAEVVEYKTILDDIYAQVNKEGEISLAALSKRTNIAQPKLEEWGKVFDKQGMLELAYPFVGGALLRKKGYISKAPEKKKEALGQVTAQNTTQATAQNSPAQNTAAEAGKTVSGVNVALTKEEQEAENKLKKKKSSGFILIILVLVLLALIGVAAYLLINGGYLHLG